MWKQILCKIPRKSQKRDRDSSRIPCGGSKISSPGSDLGLVSSVANAPKRASAAVFPASVIVGVGPLVAFNDVPSSEKMNLFIGKLSLCCVLFDFTDAPENIQEKELKRAILLELIEIVSQNPVKFSEPAILASFKMCSINLFRVFPPSYQSSQTSLGENDSDEQPRFDPAWSHLQLVYDFLLKFVASASLEAKIARKYIDCSFILRIIELFDSEDPRERECLKAILHRIYGKFMVHRPFIRKCVTNVFYRFAYETEEHNGIAELLDIFVSVVTGFTLPLKEEHKIFLLRALIPLHKPKSLGIYFQQLSFCIIQFIEKEPELASSAITGLLKYWPITNTQKEVIFLGELEEILEVINMPEFQKIMIPLFWRIRHCINSYHFQVAERALFLWNNDRLLNLIAHNRHIIFPVLIPALELNTRNHWNRHVLNLTLNLQKTLTEMDEVLALSCISSYNEERGMINEQVEKRKKTWEHLEKVATLQPISGNIAVLVT